jgi:N-acetylmuramoyl-L-alanine amidase
MKVSNAYSSPNFAPDFIPVEFVVLHYTAGDLNRTMSIFSDPARKVCAHFVLDTDGTVYDLGGFLNGPVKKGAHAGESRMKIEGVEHTSFNNMSVGIEIVNLNGNLFPYTGEQYDALDELLSALITRFPALKNPCRIVGHENIAGFRGKCDPGLQFDWDRVLKRLGFKPHALQKPSGVFTSEDLEFALNMMKQEAVHDETFYSRLSSSLEQRIKARQFPS